MRALPRQSEYALKVSQGQVGEGITKVHVVVVGPDEAAIGEEAMSRPEKWTRATELPTDGRNIYSGAPKE